MPPTRIPAGFSPRHLGAGLGLGAIAATELLDQARVRGATAPKAAAGTGPDLGHLGASHFPGKAKRVISIHMWGAVSQVDTFDYKPELVKWHGKEIPPSVKGKGKISAMSNAQSSFPIMKPFGEFKQYGESGHWVSNLLPYTAGIADDLTFIHTMHTEHVNHDPAAIFLHTGFQLSGRPSAGAWVNYALGTDNANLPSYVVMKSQPRSIAVGANSAAPGAQASCLRTTRASSSAPATSPCCTSSNPDGLTKETRRSQLDVIGALSQRQYLTSGDPEVLSKITQYEMAYRMQDSVPEISDISDEPEYILDMYGPEVRTPGTFARNCLIARRLLERGVKFVQLIQVGWDHHSGIVARHPVDCLSVDQPSAALVADLRQRGLLDDTLVMWGGEFGRTSYAQGGITDTSGRDHHGGNFSMWFAGGGVRPGASYGKTDDFSYNIVENPVSVHDMHATMMHLLGIDHTQLTYHYQGRDFRLTDVSGEVVKGILA